MLPKARINCPLCHRNVVLVNANQVFNQMTQNITIWASPAIPQAINEGVSLILYSESHAFQHHKIPEIQRSFKIYQIWWWRRFKIYQMWCGGVVLKLIICGVGELLKFSQPDQIAAFCRKTLKVANFS